MSSNRYSISAPMTMSRTAAVLLLLSPWLCSASRADRQQIDWDTDWKFLNSEAGPTDSTATWNPVQIPHTWNVGNYRRGAGWYAKSFTAPTSWRGKRVFVFFEAVSIAADVYLNGTKLQRHEGSFTAFCIELTSSLKWDGPNELRVRADNSKLGIAPISADFNFNGGIYRPVHILVTDESCISPLNYGSPGVYVTQRNVDANNAQIEVKTLLSHAGKKRANLQIETEILDAKNTRVAFARDKAPVEAGQGATAVQTLSIPTPHLWNGLKDPYLYSVRVRVQGKGVSDEVTQPLGIRTLGFDAQERFVLNGALYPLHGVNRHQDLRGKAWALTDADHATDIAMIKEIGATTVRLAHYPQSHTVLELCDKNGLLCWEEIPTVNRILEDAKFRDNARLQLTEMILQGYNHPSIMMWGLFNEVTTPAQTTPHVLVEQLRDLAHSLDPSRPTVGATDNATREKLNRAPGHIGFNVYPGWYFGTTEDYRGAVKERSDSMGGKRIALSEYGGGGSAIQHQEGELKKPVTNRGKFHPEEYQTYLHQRAWMQLKDNPHIWGTFVWAMFDFAVQGRNEGDRPNINDKGLVTDDRKTKKDAFYFYKANWNPQPMVYITSRRMTPRKAASTQVKVFSNASEVELFVNGKSLGKAKPDGVNVFRWEKVQLSPGTNKVEARATANGQNLSDSCEWLLQGNDRVADTATALANEATK